MNLNKFLKIDLSLFFIIITLTSFGLFFLYSASGENFIYVQNQFYRIVLGIIVMLIIANIPANYFITASPYLFFMTIVLLIFVLLFGIEINGATRWLRIPGILSFQPSELIKIFLPLFMAFLVQNFGLLKNYSTLFFSFISLFIPTLLVIFQPDLGTAILIFLSGFSVIFLSGISWIILLFLALSLIIIIPLIFIFVLRDYQKERIFTLFDPNLDPLGSGYQIIQSKISIGSGGFLGQGWLNGLQTNLGYVPEQRTDFIFAVIAEESGFVGVLFLFVLYGLLLFKLYKYFLKMDLLFYKLVTFAYIVFIGAYIFVNVAMVSGLLPVVGLPLPFISYGGTSLMVLFVMIGIISSFKNNSLQEDKVIIKPNIFN